MTIRRALAPIALVAALAACDPPAAPEAGSPAADPAGTAADTAQASPASDAPPVSAPTTSEGESAPAADDAPAFAGKVWRVVKSEGVEAGTTYAFLADGTLVIENPVGNPPGYGKWRFEDGKLTIEEEGIAYPTDIVRSDAAHLTLRSHNPGGALDIELEHAPDAPLPKAPGG